MISSTLTQPTIEELAHRENDGIQVSLRWNGSDNSLSVVVRDARTAERFELSVEPEQAVDAFQHPFAYGASNGVVPEGAVSTYHIDQAVAELEQQTLWYL
jgi:YD repeat-containing protein